MGKCPQCDCKQIWETECLAEGSADQRCLKFCIRDYHHIDCTGHKETSGPCICPKQSESLQCGSDGIMYENSCRRRCAGVSELPKMFCEECRCRVVWLVTKCGKDLGFEKQFSRNCIEKCDREWIRTEEHSFISCDASKSICQCPREENEEETPMCGDDHIVYPSYCALHCSGRKMMPTSQCPKCNCLESIWSKECEATDVLPILPECRRYCSNEKRLLTKKQQALICNTKTSKRACVCTTKSNTQCGMDGENYKNGCERKCNDVSEVAYWGDCVSKQCDCRKVWNIMECKQPGIVDQFCRSECEKPKAATFVSCKSYYDGVCVCNTRVGKPHCGSDGTVYPNKCVLNCLGIHGSKYFKVLPSGKCEETQLLAK